MIRLHVQLQQVDRRRRSAAARELSHEIAILLADNVIDHEPIS